MSLEILKGISDTDNNLILTSFGCICSVPPKIVKYGTGPPSNFKLVPHNTTSVTVCRWNTSMHKKSIKGGQSTRIGVEVRDYSNGLKRFWKKFTPKYLYIHINTNITLLCCCF